MYAGPSGTDSLEEKQLEDKNNPHLLWLQQNFHLTEGGKLQIQQ